MSAPLARLAAGLTRHIGCRLPAAFAFAQRAAIVQRIGFSPVLLQHRETRRAFSLDIMRSQSAETADSPKETQVAEVEDASDPIPQPTPESHSPLVLFNSRLSKALAGNDNELVFQICKEMKAAGVQPDAYSYNALIRALVGTQNLSDAIATFQELKAAKVTPLLSTFNNMLRGASKAADVAQAEALFAEISQSGLHPSAVSFLYLTQAYTFGNKLGRAFEQLTTMKDLKLQPLPGMYTALLGSSIRLRDAGRAHEAMMHMDRARLEITPHFLYLALVLCAQQDQADGALFAYKSLIRAGKRPDDGCLIMLLDCAARVGRPDLATEVWTGLKHIYPKPPSVAYNALLHTYCKAEKLQNAFGVVNEMVELGYPMHGGTLRHLVRACATSVEQLDRAYFVLLDMLEGGKQKVSLPALNCVIMACARINEVERAFATFAELDKFGLQPDINTFNALLRGCAQTGKINSAFRCLEEIYKAKLKPNAGSYTYLIHACLRDGNVTRGLSLLRSMQQDGIVVPLEAYSALINTSARQGQDKQARAILEEARAAGHFIPADLVEVVETQGRPRPRTRESERPHRPRHNAEKAPQVEQAAAPEPTQ